MDGRPEISVLICAWNAVQDLPRLLDGLNRQTLPAERFEVLVVDNGSTDETPRVVQDAAPLLGYRLRYLFEEKAGKTNALNAGIAGCAAPIIACTDQDCRPEPDWLEQVLRSFDDPQVGLLGGPGLSVFPEGIGADPVRAFLARRFLGDFEPFDEFGEVFDRNPPLGLNLSFRKEVAEKVGGFDPDLGPNPQRHLCREDTAFIRSAQARGYRVFYQPRAIVRHYIAEDRISWRAIKKQAFESGISAFRERYAARVAGSLPRKLAYTAVFSLELAYSWLRLAVFAVDFRRRTVAHFRAVSVAGKLLGLWSRAR